MRHCDPTDTRSASRSERVPLWMLIVAFVAGLMLLGMLRPAPAAAQTAADSTVVLHWTAPGDDGNTGQASTYDLRYRTVAISGTDTTSWWNAATPVSGEPTPGTAGANDSMRVSGLVPTTTYYFLIRTADEIPNWSGFSNVAVKTTSGDISAPGTIANLSVTGATATTISLSWTAPGDDGNTGTAASYDIRYSTSTITSANWGSATQATGEPAPASSGTTQTYTLTGLQGSRTYYIAIRTTDEVGNVSAISNVVNRTTNDNVAPAPVRDLSYDESLPALDVLADATEIAR
jgi:fibronectin type III domain protein